MLRFPFLTKKNITSSFEIWACRNMTYLGMQFNHKMCTSNVNRLWGRVVEVMHSQTNTDTLKDKAKLDENISFVTKRLC